MYDVFKTQEDPKEDARDVNDVFECQEYPEEDTRDVNDTFNHQEDPEENDCGVYNSRGQQWEDICDASFTTLGIRASEVWSSTGLINCCSTA